MRLSRLLLWVALLVPGSAFAGGPSDESLQLYFRAAITIEPDGSLSSVVWNDADRIPPAVRTRLGELVRSWEFQPGEIDGHPAVTETTLRLRLLATAVEGGMALRIERADTGPSMTGMGPPEYPKEALRRGAEGQLLAALVVEPDGTRHVTVERYQGDEGQRKAFLRGVEPAFRRVEVRHERVGGIEVTARFAVPMSFCINSGCDQAFADETDRGSNLPTSAPGQPMPQGSVARVLTDVQGTTI